MPFLDRRPLQPQVLGGPFDTCWWWGSEDKTVGRGCQSGGREGQGGVGSSNGASGVGDAPACSGSSKGVPVVGADGDAHATASCRSTGGRLGWADEGGDTGGCGGERNGSKNGDNGLKTATGSGTFVGPNTPVTASDAGAARALIVEEEGCRDPLELEATKPSVSGGGVGGEQESERWRWRRGLRRMVDAGSPSVSQEV